MYVYKSDLLALPGDELGLADGFAPRLLVLLIFPCSHLSFSSILSQTGSLFRFIIYGSSRLAGTDGGSSVNFN